MNPTRPLAGSSFRTRASSKNSELSYSPLELRQLLAAGFQVLGPEFPPELAGVNYQKNQQQISLARDYLATNPDTAYLVQGNSNLRTLEIKHGLATTVTRFQQTVNGLPVADGYVTAIQGPTGNFIKVYDQGFKGKTDVRDANRFIGFQESERTALEFAGATKTFAPSRGELVWLPGEKGSAVQAVQITVFGVTPENHGDFLTYIDPVSGHVISQVNRIANFTTGSGKTFYPNPYQTQGNGANLVDNNNANNATLSAQRIDVTLQGLDEGTGLLKGEFANLSSLNSSVIADVDANEPTRVYNYTRDNPRFEQVVIYHTIDQINRYFHLLGFDNQSGPTQNGIRDFATLANAHWDNDDQSFYSSGNDAVHFGDGGVDDGEDGDIVAHEYGHAVQHNQNTAWGGGEMGAMGEGFGDYLAASFFKNFGNAAFQSAHAAAVGEWDATSYSSANPPNLRRVDGNKMYPGGLTGSVHADGEIWSRALWDINNAIGASTADKVILESHFMLPGNATMVTAAEAILTADQAINGGANAVAIRQAFVNRGILQPLPTSGTVAFSANAYNVGATVGITVTDSNAPNTIVVSVTTNNGDAESLTLNKNGFTYSGTIASTAGTPTPGDGQLQVALGNVLTATYIDTDNGAGGSVTVTATANISNVIVFSATDVPLAIPDATPSNSPRSVSSTIMIPTSGTIVDLDLKLNITHTWDNDLGAVLRSPTGAQYVLFDQIGGSGDNFTDTYFDDSATTPIGSGSPPYTGSFRPVTAFASLNGTSVSGNWVLTITDNENLDTGTLNAWSLHISLAPTNVPIGPVTDSNNSPNQVAENAVVGATVGITALAIDPDAGDTVSYSLTNNADGRFAIHSTTGVVTVAGGLDFETATSHSITVQALSSDTSTSGQSFTIAVTNVDDATVGARNLVYRGSALDDGGVGALATDKSYLMPGQKAKFVNYSSYLLGINALAIEVGDLNLIPTLATFNNFFQFKVGNNDTPSTWAAAPNPTGLTYQPNVVGTTDRILLSWANNVIQKQWLQVTMPVNATTGLAAPVVFYFGNAIGETGNEEDLNATVNLADISTTRSNQSGFSTVGITNRYDFNRDRLVNLQDVSIARTNQSGFTPLVLITPGASKSGGSNGKSSVSTGNSAASPLNGSLRQFSSFMPATTPIANRPVESLRDRSVVPVKVEPTLVLAGSQFGSIEHVSANAPVLNNIARDSVSDAASLSFRSTVLIDRAFAELEAY